MTSNKYYILNIKKSNLYQNIHPVNGFKIHNISVFTDPKIQRKNPLPTYFPKIQSSNSSVIINKKSAEKLL